MLEGCLFLCFEERGLREDTNVPHVKYCVEGTDASIRVYP